MDPNFAFAQYIPGELGALESEGWFAYDGYNPNETLKLMKIIEPKMEILMLDIKKCAFFVMCRGSKPTKAMEKMHDEGKKELTRLTVKYKVMQGTPKSKDDVTMLRIAGIVPLYCAQLMENPEMRIVGTASPSLPRCLAFASAPALIPKDRTDLYSMWLEWAVTFNQTISAGKSAEKVDFFGRVIQDAGYLTEEQKYNALKILKVLK